MVRTPVAALSDVCQTLSGNALINFLKHAVVRPDTSWTTGCRPNEKQTIIWEFTLHPLKNRKPTVHNMKAKLHQTQNDLNEQSRCAMISLLNQQLADVIDLGLQTKQAHWNVKGPHFIGLHELFDKAAEELEEFTDGIAERAMELGGLALGTIQAVSKNSRLTAYPLDLASGQRHVTALSNMYVSRT